MVVPKSSASEACFGLSSSVRSAPCPNSEGDIRSPVGLITLGISPPLPEEFGLMDEVLPNSSGDYVAYRVSSKEFTRNSVPSLKILCVDAYGLPHEIIANNVQSCYNSVGEAILLETIDIDHQSPDQDVENESDSIVTLPNVHSKKMCTFVLFVISCAIIVIGILGLLKLYR